MNQQNHDEELAEEALDQISGGITPIPIPGAYLNLKLNLSTSYLQTSLQQYATGSDGGVSD